MAVAKKKKAAKKKTRLRVVGQEKGQEKVKPQRFVEIPEDVSREALSSADRERYRKALQRERKQIERYAERAKGAEGATWAILMQESCADAIRLAACGDVWRGLALLEHYAFNLTADHRRLTTALADRTVQVGERSIAAVQALKRAAIGIMQGLESPDSGYYDECGEALGSECSECPEDCDGDCEVGDQCVRCPSDEPDPEPCV